MVLVASTDWSVAFRDVALWVIIFGALFVGVVIFGFFDIRRFRPVHGNDEFQKSRAYVTEDLDPEGLVMVQGEIWRASSRSGEVIVRGQRVKVVGREGMYLMVEPLQQNDGRF